jgi:hypothetical protein
MLPNNFNFYIGGRYDIKYLRDKEINYFIGFTHPGNSEPYSPELVFEHLGYVSEFHLFSYHDAHSAAHKDMGLKMPDEELIKEIIRHGGIIKGKLKAGEQVNAAIMCQAGISRSTATAYIILCIILGEWNEREAWAYVLNKRDVARPNPLMVSIADSLLKRNFKMIAPLKNCVDFSRKDPDSNGSCLLF